MWLTVHSWVFWFRERQIILFCPKKNIETVNMMPINLRTFSLKTKQHLVSVCICTWFIAVKITICLCPFLLVMDEITYKNLSSSSGQANISMIQKECVRFLLPKISLLEVRFCSSALQSYNRFYNLSCSHRVQVILILRLVVICRVY